MAGTLYLIELDITLQTQIIYQISILFESPYANNRSLELSPP